jgi:hypothetical protein
MMGRREEWLEKEKADAITGEIDRLSLGMLTLKTRLFLDQGREVPCRTAAKAVLCTFRQCMCAAILRNVGVLFPRTPSCTLRRHTGWVSEAGPLIPLTFLITSPAIYNPGWASRVGRTTCSRNCSRDLGLVYGLALQNMRHRHNCDTADFRFALIWATSDWTHQRGSRPPTHVILVASLTRFGIRIHARPDPQ